MTTVKEMRRIANKMLAQMEGWDDDDEVVTKSNTYFIEGLAIETRGGFVDWTDIRLEEEDEEEEDDWEEEDE